MARVLLLSLTFPPDGVSTAQLMGELAVDLEAAGHTVSVLTTTPHYNRDEAAEARQPLSWSFWPLLRRSRLDGMSVRHIRMPRKGKSLLLRGMAWVWFHVASVVLGAGLGWRADVVLAPSPPLTIGMAAWLLARLGGGRFIYNVQEIYPDVAVNLGMLRNRTLIRLLEGVERFVYQRAYAITVISPRMRERLQEKGVPSEKLWLVPNWVDLKEMRPLPKCNDFSRAHGLDDRFVVSYAGNFGPTQRLDTLVEAAALLRDRPGIRFLLAGGGTDYDRLRELIAERGLENVVCLSHQPYEIVPSIYAASDLSVVPQLGAISNDAAPSKTYRILACARPVLALTRAGSDLAQIVEEAEAGIVVDEGDAARLAERIVGAAADPERWRKAGARGRAHVLRRYERRRVTALYDALVREASASDSNAM